MSDFGRLRWTADPLRTGWLCLAALLGIDLVFVAADALYRSGYLSDPRFSLGRERGYPELFQYAKFAGLAALLAWSAAHDRSSAAFVLAIVFLYLLADDAFAVHERAGNMIGSALGLPTLGSLGPHHLGELLFLLAVGTGVALCLGYVLRSGAPQERGLVFAFGSGLALLAVAGVGGDVLHTAFRRHALGDLLGVLEDGGEMAVTSLLLAGTVVLHRSGAARRNKPREGGQPQQL